MKVKPVNRLDGQYVAALSKVYKITVVYRHVQNKPAVMADLMPTAAYLHINSCEKNVIHLDLFLTEGVSSVKFFIQRTLNEKLFSKPHLACHRRESTDINNPTDQFCILLSCWFRVSPFMSVIYGTLKRHSCN